MRSRSMTVSPRRPLIVTVASALVVMLLAAAPAAASDAVQWNGFALLSPQTPSDGVPLDDDALSAQVQIGIDWQPSVVVGAHVHLLARNESDGSRRGRIGVVEAYLEQVVGGGRDRFHFKEGAFFLPTSRENIDSLWETPYTITSSALNSWLGQELRPVGIDLSYAHRTRSAGTFTGGGTVFRGNDTFGALIIDRGWAFSDHWALLGEHIPVNATFFTSVSAENDHRLGWSARGGWHSDRGTLQITRIDNRSDALRYGELFNWATRFNIAGADYTWNDWTAVAETGWGSTAIQGSRGRFSASMRTSYLLVSRRIASLRASVRADQYQIGRNHGHAFTAALFWERPGRLRPGIEAISAEGKKRLAVELRCRF